MIAAVLIQAAMPYSGDPPGWLAYTAIGWAVTITTTVSGLVLTGNLRLGREITAAEKSGDEQTALYKALYEEEKGRRLKVQDALDATVEDLRLQNKTLAGTVAVLQHIGRAEVTPS